MIDFFVCFPEGVVSNSANIPRTCCLCDHYATVDRLVGCRSSVFCDWRLVVRISTCFA